MKVVGDEAISMHFKPGLLARLGESLEEILPVYVIKKNVLPAVAPAQDVIDGPGVLRSNHARHRARFSSL
jgi:hypothetical protein